LVESLNERLPGSGCYRLPLQEEWREVSDDLAGLVGSEALRYGWLEAAKPRDVGKFRPNRAGLLDLVGNVAEWTSSVTDGGQVVCGGSFASRASAYRVHDLACVGANEPNEQVGWRLIWEGALHG